jgi:tetratricopeptide (TPR) repeat protein
VRLQQLYREPGISSMHYLLTQCRVMVTYIRLAFFPFNQNLDYDYPVYKSILQAPVFLSVLFLGTIFFFAKHLFLKYRLVSFSILWFFLTLLPESSLLPIRDVIYEHRLYLPLVGFCMFLVSGGYYLLGRNAIKMMLIPLMMAITCYSVLAYQRNKIWQDEFTLWNDTVEKSPNKARPHYNRGHSYDKQGDTIQAIADYDKAIELDPDYADAYYNRGLILAKQNKFQQAVEDFTKTIAIKSDYAGAYNNRGIIYARQGNYPKAISDFTQALAIDPDDAKIYCNLGNTYYDQGNLTQAVLDYNKAIELDPIDTQAVNNRAIVCNQSPLSCK